jgi:hypothetical protein
MSTRRTQLDPETQEELIMRQISPERVSFTQNA